MTGEDSDGPAGTEGESNELRDGFGAQSVAPPSRFPDADVDPVKGTTGESLEEFRQVHLLDPGLTDGHTSGFQDEHPGVLRDPAIHILQFREGPRFGVSRIPVLEHRRVLVPS